MRTDPSVLRILKVASRSQEYFCSTISSKASTAKAPETKNRKVAARMMRAVTAALWAAQIIATPRNTRASQSEAATEEPSSRLFIPQRYHRIDLHRAPRRKVTGKRCRPDEQSHDGRVGRHVRRGHAEEQGSEQPRKA